MRVHLVGRASRVELTEIPDNECTALIRYLKKLDIRVDFYYVPPRLSAT